MLVQVGSVSVKKAAALVERFRTPRNMLEEICYSGGGVATTIADVANVKLRGSGALRVHVGRAAGWMIGSLLGVAETSSDVPKNNSKKSADVTQASKSTTSTTEINSTVAKETMIATVDAESDIVCIDDDDD
uniref:Uncharacterized protein n=1 Tax=Corethron hystrix TaxID=216773 RepID=A0A7S1FUE1_9STRA